MYDKYYNVREFLSNCGFVQPDMNSETGVHYVYLMPAEKARFDINLTGRVCSAYYPDLQYNKKNINAYSTKETVVSLKWEETDSPELIIQNLKDFFTKILTILGRV